MVEQSNFPTSDYDDVQLLTVKEVASRLGISVRGVWRLNSTGELPKPLYLGRLARWKRSVIKKWIDEKCSEDGGN